MHSRPIGLSLVVLAATASLTGCAMFDAGATVSEERTITDVQAVVLDTSGELTVTLGSEPSLTISAGEKLIDRLTTEVTDGTLRLGIAGEPTGWNGPIRYELTISSLEELTVLGSGDADADFTGALTPSITVKGSGDVGATGVSADTASITVEGSGDIQVESLSTEELTVRIEGSGNITIDGDAAAQDIDVAGAGDYQAGELRSDHARIVIAGSGRAEVDVRQSLDAVIDGSGDIVYSGDPRVTKNVSGSGEVSRR